jgi:hypothetical protein
MTLNKDQYTAFEDIVGAEYISDDPATIPTHGVRAHAPGTFSVIRSHNLPERMKKSGYCQLNKFKSVELQYGWGLIMTLRAEGALN